MGIYEKLLEYGAEDYYPMHMPGHKRNPSWFMENPYLLDITEIEDFDNLKGAEGILLDGMERAARVYHSEEAYYLVNGSTAGILISIFAAARPLDTILMARNSHKAVYSAAFLRQLRVEYLYPEIDADTGILGSITPKHVEDKLHEFPHTALVIITSPTYDGVTSDLKEIAKVVHIHGIPLIVDAAHGAHFGFHKSFPDNAIASGADLVIHSLHKTLPALTQTALLHRNGTLVDRREVKCYFDMFQSSSPSYLFMAGIDRCIDFLENQAAEAFCVYADRLYDFYLFSQNLKYIKLWRPMPTEKAVSFDNSKIILWTADCLVPAIKLYEKLVNEYHIQPEMVLKNYVLCMTSVCDTAEGFERLKQALAEIDMLSEEVPEEREKGYFSFLVPERELFYYETLGKKEKLVSIMESKGCICAELVYLYPPGIPLLVPGEIITEAFILQLREYIEAGFQLKGLEDTSGNRIRIIV